MNRAFRGLYIALMLKFLFFWAATIIVVIAAVALIDTNAVKIMTDYSEEIIREGSIVIRYSESGGIFETDANFPEYFGIEVLKDNRVIYRQGSRLGNEESYSQEEINAMLQRHYRLLDYIEYIPEYIPFTGTDGKPYALLVKIPKDSEEAKIKSGVAVPLYLVGTEFEMEIFRLIRNLLLASVAALLIIVFFLSRITWTSVIRPLTELIDGLGKVNKGRFDTVLDFRAHKDFRQVSNAFNKMTEDLHRQQEENRRLTEGKKQFILDLSHDLRTPITTICGYSEALVNGMVNTEAEKEKYLQYINTKSKVMAGLINRLFDYSRLESGKEILQREPLDMADCFRYTIINYYGELEAAEFGMEIRIPEHPVFIKGSRVELERGIGNIISNQIKFNPPKTRVFYSLEETGDHIRLTLKDEGIGIEEKVLGRIFDVMVRGDESRHGVSGTGLGLAITKKVIELHDGRIEVESLIGEGTSFYITLPKINEI